MLKKAVVPAAGLGKRLLPLTKELPKEMVPVIALMNGQIGLKPMLQDTDYGPSLNSTVFYAKNNSRQGSTKLRDNSKHEIAFHVVNDPYRELELLVFSATQ